MLDEIPLIPTIPDGLKLAAKQGTLIPFIGAGASRLAGCPGWFEFADGAIRFFVNAGKYNLSQLEQIKHLSPRVKLSAALALQEQHKLYINFDDLLHPKGNYFEAQGQKLYASLSKLAKTFITTNHDRWLDEEIVLPDFSTDKEEADASKDILRNPRNVIYKVEDFTHDNLNRSGTVIHLHGSVIDSDHMILTTRQYINYYANDRFGGNSRKENRVLTFLENLFKLKNVLFVGYGLDELEILEYIISKARQAKNTGTPESKHFLLQGFFTHELELARHLETYYLLDCGIQLIPYSRDNKDWGQLLDVVEDFARRIPATDPLVSQELYEMKALLNA